MRVPLQGASRRATKIVALVGVAGLASAIAGCGAISATTHAATASNPPPATIQVASVVPTAASAQPRGSCANAVTSTLGALAMRVYDTALKGPLAQRAVARVTGSAALGAAVARGDARASRAALLPLLKHQIRRIEIYRGNRLLVDIGRRVVPIAPVAGAIRAPGGGVAGRYVLGVTPAAAFAGVTDRLTGGSVVVRSGSRTIAGTPAHAPAASRAFAFRGRAFPTGPLRVSLRLPPVALRSGCAATRAETAINTLGAAAQRLYRAEVSGTGARNALRYAVGDPAFRSAVASGDSAAITRVVTAGFFHVRRLHIVRVRVTQGGRQINATGGPFVLAPASATMPGPGGRPATVSLSVQDDTGYIKLIRRLVGAQAVLRTPSGQVPGSALHPASGRLPARGIVAVAGRRWRVSSFNAQQFPSGPLRISILVPA